MKNISRNPDFRYKVEAVDQKLNGLFRQYLLGNAEFDEVALEIIQTLLPKWDLIPIHRQLEKSLEELEEWDPNHEDIRGYLKDAISLVEEKMGIQPKKPQVKPAPYVPPLPHLPGVLSDGVIRDLSSTKDLITPFSEHCSVRKELTGEVKVISYGLSSYGYDIRLADDVMMFSPVQASVVDPKNFDPKILIPVKSGEGGFVTIPPHGVAIASSVEKFKIPRDLIVKGIGKSTYTRAGILVNMTPLEPEWCGHLTLEISNTTPLPARVYPGEGILQLIFFRAAVPCEVSYKDRGGKYQGAVGVTLPKLKDSVSQP